MNFSEFINTTIDTYLQFVLPVLKDVALDRLSVCLNILLFNVITSASMYLVLVSQAYSITNS